MSNRSGRDDRKKLRAEDVLAGRIKVSAVELLDLIHRINPTGRELPPREADLRYAQKARLQSLLVRRFGPELTVVPDPEHEGTVSLLHRGHGRDGCHAVLDTLDEDARAWVQLQLDLGPPSSEALPAPAPAARPSSRGLPPEDEDPPSADASPAALVRQAGGAMEAYDFERARVLLERAVTASGGAAEPAAALLALLVETLGDDEGAIALQRSLSPSAMAHAGVRGLLALAAARSGDLAQALELLQGAHEQRTAEIHAALAARVLKDGDAEEAAAHLAELRKRDPAHPAILGLSNEIARLRAAARGPLEAEIAALVAEGNEAEAEKKAAEVLSRWPESEPARRVIRAAEERRRRAKEDAERRAREAEAAREAKREAERVEQVRAQLAAPDPREGLLAWLALDPALRRRVGETPAAELCRALELTPARVAAPARVDAVLAIAVARQRLAIDPQGAADTLAPHEATLERVPEARRILREAHAELAARRAARAREEVHAARRELDAGDAAAALARLSSPLVRDLAAEDHAEAEALRATAAAIVARHERAAEVGRLRRTGHLFEARALAGALAAEASPEERPRWEAERQAIQGEIQRSFCVEIEHEPVPFEDGMIADATQPMMEAPVWLTEDGRTLVLAEARERWVWIQLVDVTRSVVRAQAVLRAPERLGFVVFHVLGRAVWLVGERGGMLAVDLDHFTVEMFRPAREMVGPEHHTGGFAIAADRGAAWPRYIWAMPADKDGYGCPVRVLDLETRRLVREVPEVIRLAAIPGTREATVGCFKAAGLVLHEDRGVPMSRFPRQDVSIVFAAVHPAGEGLVGAGAIGTTPWQIERHPPPGSRRKQAPRSTAEKETGLVDLSVAGSARAPFIIEDVDNGTLLALASSLDTGLVAVALVRLEERWELLVLRPTAGRFELLYRVDMPPFSVIVRDAGARHLFLHCARPLLLVPIEANAPALPPTVKRPSPWVADLFGAPVCIGSAGARAEVYATVRATLNVPTYMIAATSRNLQRENNPEMVVERVRALVGVSAGADADAQRLRDWLWERHRDNARVRVLRADELAHLGRWAEVREVLAPCSPASFADDEDHAQHCAHLLALAALHVGDVDAARRHIAEAAAHAGSCRVDALQAVLAPRIDPGSVVRGGAVETADPPLLTQLVWAIHAADASLAAGDPEAALAALDPCRFETFDEVQVLARRVEAWLMLSPPPGHRRFAKIMTVARLLDAHARGPDEEREELPVPGAKWDRDRLDDVARRAGAWLSAEGA